MNEFWTTVLSTAGASAIISGIITSVASIWLQHKYNRKIESFKADLSQMLNEKQTRFNWWYLEKAKAIKTIYANLADMRYLLQKLHSIETDPNWKSNQQYYEKTRQETYLSFLAATEKNSKDWLNLRLFFDRNDDYNIAKSISVEADFFAFHLDRVTKNEIEDLIKKEPEMLYEVEKMMTQLRDDFQVTLGVQKHNTEASAPQAPVDTSSKDEVKS